jgi:hypothetical protein
MLARRNRSNTYVVRIAVYSAAVLTLTGCEDRSRAVSEPAYPFSATVPVASPDSPTAGSAYPYPMATGPVPSLHPVVEQLPSDTVLQRDRAASCPRESDSPKDRVLHLVPATSTQGSDLIAVASDLDRSVAGWRLRPNLPLGLQRSEIAIDTMHPSRNHIVARATVGSERALLFVHCRLQDLSPLDSVAHDLRLVGALGIGDNEGLLASDSVWATEMDWTGDDQPEIYVEYRAKDDRTLGLLFIPGAGGLWRPAMELGETEEEFVLDLDRDGVVDVVRDMDDGSWLVRRWTGDRVEEQTILTPGILPAEVDQGSLPPLPIDVYARREGSTDTAATLWPARGGPLQHVDADSELSMWKSTADASQRTSDESADLRTRARHVAGQPEARDLGDNFVRAKGIPPGATTDGFIVVETSDGADSSPEPSVVATVTTYALEHDSDLGERGFVGLRMSSKGDRLGWADGIGLWVMNLPADTPQLLHAWGAIMPAYQDGSAGLHYPLTWSADSSYLLVHVRYWEGSAHAVWSMATSSVALISRSFSYAGGYSDVQWLGEDNQLIHARSGTVGTAPDEQSRAVLSLVDPVDSEREQIIIRAWPNAWRGNLKLNVLGFTAGPNDNILFGLQSNMPIDPDTNGFFTIQRDGTGMRRIAALPDAQPEAVADGHQGQLLCELLFSPDASTFLCHNPGSSWPRAYLGRVDTGEIWDATSIFNLGTAYSRN